MVGIIFYLNVSLSDNQFAFNLYDLKGEDYFYPLTANQEDPDIKSKELKRKLYRAPELLSRNRSSGKKGSQKGDIYSFGILLYEIVGRAGPWGDVNIDDEGITFNFSSPMNKTRHINTDDKL